MSLPFNHKITQAMVAGGRAYSWELSMLPCWSPSQLQGPGGEGSALSATGIWLSLLQYFPSQWTLNTDAFYLHVIEMSDQTHHPSHLRHSGFILQNAYTDTGVSEKHFSGDKNHLRGGGTGKLPLSSFGCYFYQASLSSAWAGLKPEVSESWKQQSCALGPAARVVSLELGCCLITSEEKLT